MVQVGVPNLWKTYMEGCVIKMRKNKEMPDKILETNVNFVDVDDMVSATVFLKKHMNQLHKLAENHPDEVKIIKEAKENDGMMLAHLPKKYVKVSFGEPMPKKVMTEEQKAAAAERMRKAQEAKKAKLEAERIDKEKLEEGWL